MNAEQLLNRFFYRPERGFFVTPDQLGLAYEDVVFRAQDGTGLHGWLVPGPGPASILFCHGVAGNISHRAQHVAILQRHLGATVFVFDYRGYGRSAGEPSEEGTYLDAEAAFKVLCQRPGLDPSRIVLFGHSMGGAVAIELALRLGRRVCGLVVESSFTSGREVARMLVPVVPDSAVPEFYCSRAKIAQLQVPVLIIHGEQDSVLPVEMAWALFDAAAEPKSLFLVPDADHHDVHLVGGPVYRERLASFLAQAGGARRVPRNWSAP